MHPEIRQEGPGRCPICGMALVPETSAKPRVEFVGGNSESLSILTWRNYVPLIVIFLLLAAGTAAASWNSYQHGAFALQNFIEYFMAGFFLVFSGFKLMDLQGFAEGYSTYDLLAQRWFGYGYVYPFIELGFGLCMLSGLLSPALVWAEIIVMFFSGAGVFIKLAKGEKFQCACLGTFLKVPLTYVSLLEDFGMAALGLLLILLI